MNWVTTSGYWNSAGYSQWQDPDKADPWLIATALVNKQVIVTRDVGNLPDKDSESKKEPKISAVAANFNVETIPMYQLFERIGFQV